MGRKAATPAPVPIAPPEPQIDDISTSEAAREALAELGVDASGGAISAWISSKHPGLKVNPQTLSSIISAQRKRLRLELGLLPGQTAGKPNLDDLMRVKEIAEQNGGTDAFLALVVQVEEAARVVGGVGRLKSTLEGLKRLTS